MYHWHHWCFLFLFIGEKDFNSPKLTTACFRKHFEEKITTTAIDVTKFTKCFKNAENFYDNSNFGLIGDKNTTSGLAKRNKIPLEQIKSGQHDVELENIGDGICHDFLNRPECGFDGGDCCLKDLITSDESDVHKVKTCFGCMCYNSDTLTENCPGKKQYIGRFLI